MIENTRRNLNIALINELAMIFNKLDIDTQAVLEATGRKWNFLPFCLGLVSGHCIGVAPYYVTHKAKAIGYYPQIIFAGRRLNDGICAYVAAQLIKAMIAESIQIERARVLVKGLTSKENCRYLRNVRVADNVSELKQYSIAIGEYDPWMSVSEAEHERCN